MADEPAAAEPTVETDAATQAEAEVETADQQPEPVDWEALEATLEKAYTADPKAAADRLKRHRAIGGIAGNLAEQRYARLQQERDAENEQRIRQQQMEELEKEARDNPLAFADRFLTQQEANKQRERVLNVERNAAKSIMEQIGAAYHGLPEWKELSDDEKGKLAAAIANTPENEVLPKFNRAALDIVAERRSAKKVQAALEKEKESWRKEWEAERLTREGGPDLRSPSSVQRRRVNWLTVNDKDFDRMMAEKYPGIWSRTTRD